MAKSFHNILDDGKIEVSHRGEDVTLTLPAWLTEASPVLMDEELLVEWAKENEVLHGLIHSGIQQEIIRLRAVARPPVDTKTDTSLSIILDKENAQDRMNEYVCKPTLPPGQASNKKVSEAIAIERTKMETAMRMAGVNEDIISATIAQLK